MCISELMEEGRCPIISGAVLAEMPCGTLQILNLEARPPLKEFQTGRSHQGAPSRTPTSASPHRQREVERSHSPGL